MFAWILANCAVLAAILFYTARLAIAQQRLARQVAELRDSQTGVEHREPPVSRAA